MTNNLTGPSLEQLRHAVAIKEKIETLERELSVVLAGGNSVARPGRFKRSAATRAKMALAQKARWSKLKGTGVAAAKPVKRTISAAGRAKLAAAAKARWKKAKAAGKKTLGG